MQQNVKQTFSSALTMAGIGHLLPTGQGLLSSIDASKYIRIVDTLMDMAESRHTGSLPLKVCLRIDLYMCDLIGTIVIIRKVII